jgi:hypothetical protein
MNHRAKNGARVVSILTLATAGITGCALQSPEGGSETDVGPLASRASALTTSFVFVADQPPTESIAGGPPAFAVPSGGSYTAAPNSFGGYHVEVFECGGGSPIATRETDSAGRALTTEYQLGNGMTVDVSALYLNPNAPDPNTPSPDAPVYCGDNHANPVAAKWTSTFYYYWNQASTPSYLSLSHTQDSIINSHTEWGANDNWCGIPDLSALTTSYVGTTSASVGYNGQNTIGFGNVDAIGCSGAVACTLRWSSNGVIQEADTRLHNDTSRVYWINGGASGRTDIWSTLAHEFGHAIGFEHVPYSSEVMYPYVTTNDITMRKLGKGDANADNNKY